MEGSKQERKERAKKTSEKSDLHMHEYERFLFSEILVDGSSEVFMQKSHRWRRSGGSFSFLVRAQLDTVMDRERGQS